MEQIYVCVGVRTSWGTVLKGLSVRTVENHCSVVLSLLAWKGWVNELTFPQVFGVQRRAGSRASLFSLHRIPFLCFLEAREKGGTELEGLQLRKWGKTDKGAGCAREQAPGARASDWVRLVFKVLPISRSSRGFTSSLGLRDSLAGVGSFS